MAFSSQIVESGSGHVFGQPILKLEIALDFAALVTMFERFFGLIIGLSEGMLGVPHCFVDYFQCPGHSSNSFLES